MISDPAEAETEERRKASFASTFDRLVESNMQLVKTVRVAIVVVTASAVISMSWSAFTTFSMRSTLVEIRVMLQTVLDNVTRSHL
jgi:hypothetical protein